MEKVTPRTGSGFETRFQRTIRRHGETSLAISLPAFFRVEIYRQQSQGYEIRSVGQNISALHIHIRVPTTSPVLDLVHTPYWHLYTLYLQQRCLRK